MTPEPIAIVAPDGGHLRGQRWPGGGDWVVLLHDVGEAEDLDRWRPLVPLLLGQGAAVLAFDLRGHGASDGEWSADTAAGDVIAAIRFARERGAESVFVIAAGVSAAATMEAVDEAAVAGLVLVSPVGAPNRPARHPEGTRPPMLRGKGERGGGWGPRLDTDGVSAVVPKLILVGAHDAGRRQVSDRLRAAASGWALTVSLPTADQGTALLTGPFAGHVQEHILHFLAEQRILARNARRHGAALEFAEEEGAG